MLVIFMLVKGSKLRPLCVYDKHFNNERQFERNPQKSIPEMCVGKLPAGTMGCHKVAVIVSICEVNMSAKKTIVYILGIGELVKPDPVQHCQEWREKDGDGES